MKKLIMMIVVANVAAMPLIAETETVGGYTWTYRIDDNTAIACGTIGDGWISCGITPFPTGSVTIPSVLGGKSVVGLDTYLFHSRYRFTGVTIPDTIKNIGTHVFEGCWGLTGVDVPCGVTNIGSYAFYDCMRLKSIIIPDEVSSIGEHAFEACTNLDTIVIGKGCNHIGNLAFNRCSSLTSVTIPQYVCTNRFSVIFPSSYQSITNVAIQEGVTCIGSYAFSGCSSLKSLVIPNSVTNIADKAFDGCKGLTSVTIGGTTMSTALLRFFGRGIDGDCCSTTIVQQVESRYDLTNRTTDRSIASITVNGNCSIGSFVLTNGKVYDSVLYISNVADDSATLTLPNGYVYKAFKGTTPLTIPAQTQSILSITRIADSVFLVSREDLETIP